MFEQIGTGLLYNDASHKYKYCDMPIDSVTTILNNDKPIPDAILRSDKIVFAMEFGTLVHHCTEADDKGVERPIEHMTGAYRCADLWQKWLKDRNAKVIEIEIGVVNAEWWYAGRVDRIVEIAGKNYIIDIKSGALATKGRYQCAGYQMALEEMGWEIEGSGLVSLKLDDWKESFIKPKHFDKWKEILARRAELNGQ